MYPVDYCTVNRIEKIYKDDEPANNIEALFVKDTEGNEIQFSIVVGKELWKVGNECIYIQPDYCIPNKDYFVEYHEPEGNSNKTKLGKQGRIRAIKFNFHFEDREAPIYSNGIIVPLSILNGENVDAEDLMTFLEVTKYEAPQKGKVGQSKGYFPTFMYKTDEPRIENYKGKVEYCAENNIEVSGTLKRDGSSVTVYSRHANDELSQGICSRNMEKKLHATQVTGYMYKDRELRKHYDQERKLKGWLDETTYLFHTQDDVNQLDCIPIEKEVRDSFVDAVNKDQVLEGLERLYNEYGLQLALRGELIGPSSKGSGNKLNTDRKLKENKIIWFGVDDLSTGFSVRLKDSDEWNLKRVCDELNLECTQEIFSGVYSYNELIEECEKYFKRMKEEGGKLVEGVVIRSKYTNGLSVKYINGEYDSKS